MSDHRAFYAGRRVMITGGLGFIGSNLARALVALGADVLLVDALIPEHGGNPFNIAGIEDRLRVNIADIRTATTIDYLVRGCSIIFNLAGQVSHIDSMRPADRKRIDIGSFYADSTRLRAATGWAPAVGLREGLARTVGYYREHYGRYVEGPAAAVPVA